MTDNGRISLDKRVLDDSDEPLVYWDELNATDTPAEALAVLEANDPEAAASAREEFERRFPGVRIT